MNETITEGCEDIGVARQRAAEMVAVAQRDAESFWSRRAAQLLAPLLNAAALAGCEPGGIAAALLEAPGGSSTQQAVRATALDTLERYSAFTARVHKRCRPDPGRQPQRRYRVAETRRERFERLQLAAGSYARHALSALILYVIPAGVVFVLARGLQRRVRGGAR